MSTIIIGGSGSGKSMLGQSLARAQGGPLYYIATMIPHDPEDAARIDRHRREREGWGFVTVERGQGILGCLERTNVSGTFLLDSVTALLANEMFASDGFHPEAGRRIAEELEAFSRIAPKSIFVSDWIFSDAEAFDASTRAYCSALGHIHRRLAGCCDNVIEAVSGLAIAHKGVWRL